MARKNSAPSTGGSVTFERALRLCRLLKFLGTGPKTRTALIRKLSLGVRGFYRDLEVLRAAGVELALVKDKYRLEEESSAALAKLPFPDPALTFGEAQLLAKGRTRAHRKLQDQIRAIDK